MVVYEKIHDTLKKKENPKESEKELLELIREFSEVTEKKGQYKNISNKMLEYVAYIAESLKLLSIFE